METHIHSEEKGTIVDSSAQVPAVDKAEGSAQADPMKVSTAKAAKGGMLRPFKQRNFNLLFSGQTVSIIGDALYMVALPWLVLTTGGNAQELGIILAAYGIPRAASILAGGWLADRLRPRKVMLIADGVRLLLMAILAALALGGHPTLWQLCAIAVPLGAFGGAFLPASMSILPDILSNEDLQAGNGVMSASVQGANLIGSAVAGAVVAIFTAGVALAIDAATFLVSALSLALMRPIQRAAAEAGQAEADQPRPTIVTQGEQVSLWRFLASSRLIQLTLLLFGLISLVSGGQIEVALPALIHGTWHSSASSYGFILAAWGAGALGGSILIGMLGNLQRKGLLTLLAGFVVSVMIALLPVWGVPGAIACMFVGGIANSVVTILFFTAVQLAIPRHLMGRVMGLLMFCNMGLYPLSVALAGVLTNQFGPALLFPFGGLLLALAFLLGLSQKAMREL
ncbi:MFS transporter [Ktedonosporobacter rubrisoli]|uniref:MFS transporter n=1 Tax=Ktedonosporobacter rubrisoli TaxID=2509675 RepID=A0A4V0YZT6_KTERU|nr:MFS transporter [Ktedonosporobacter rubrisoli]QBD80851.1 MFS transporter [Ktedonosporobacter rubrisoli]